jgi:hypothetical protein
MSWDQASAPGQLGRKAFHLATGDDPPEEWARPTTNTVHWTTGAGWGLLYGLTASATSRGQWLRALVLGPAAWLSGYLVLPLTGVYKPIWKYNAQTLADDLSAHMLYGTVASTVFHALTKQPS